MCSVLLILLLFVVIFDLVKDSTIQVHVEEKGQAKKGNCEKKLVFTSERSHHIELQSFERSEEYPQYAPFERPCLLVQDWGRNGCPRGHLPLEVRLLCKTQQKDSYNLPKVPITLEQGYAPQHRTERQRDSIQNGHLGCLGYLGSKCADLGRRLLELASISIDPKAAHAEPTRQERESERKGEQRKGNQKGKEGPMWQILRPLHLLRLLYHPGLRQRPQVHLCLQPPVCRQQLCRQATPHRM